MQSIKPVFEDSFRQLILLGLCLSMATWSSQANGIVLDDFEDVGDWKTSTSEGVDLEIAQDKGHTGMAMRLDFDFHDYNGGGFVLARKTLPITLPANYSFSFYIRGEAPLNNFEFKLIDPSGQNVWWFNRRNFEFPRKWQKITIKKRHIGFAWGPAGGELKEAATIEFAISAGKGKKGSVWIDELIFEEREPLAEHHEFPLVRASTTAAGYEASSVFEKDPATMWKSGSIAEGQWLQLDFKQKREYGGLIIDWGLEDYAEAYEVQISDNGKDWARVYSVASSNGDRDYVYLPDSESRYLRLDLQRSSRGQGYSIESIEIKPYQFSASPNNLFAAIARDSARGAYPRYFSGEQSYWTVVGVNGDQKEALINEEGMVEIDKTSFSIEPFLYIDDRLITWNDVNVSQELENDYLPIPSVLWDHSGLKLKITSFAAGESGESLLYLRYQVKNTTDQKRQGKLFLALRPFQVNPPWQSLNMTGGMGHIKELFADNGTIRVNNNKTVISLSATEHFGAVKFAQGSITDFLRTGTLPRQSTVFDHLGYASGALEYPLDLLPRESKEVYLIVPFHQTKPLVLKDRSEEAIARLWTEAFDATHRYWESKLNLIDLQLPSSPATRKIVNTLKTTLAYILINRDGSALQPGSRAYERSWIRDGAITSTALMNLGHTQEVRKFIEWYADYQFSNGKVPCCVDTRGADSVPENDSHGQWIYLVMEYYRNTRDTGFLTEMWPYVVKAANYINHLRQQRITEAYLKPEKSVLYGLVPESISHEGYSSNPVHSYWDDFFTLRGLKDATDIATILGEEEYATNFKRIRDAFSEALFESITRSITMHGIDFIPGAAELGDFDPAATTIGIDPVGEMVKLPQAALTRTFEKYYQILRERSQDGMHWEAYTPYELRAVGTFIRMGLKDRAHEALDFFFQDQRPPAWNHWGEIVWRDRNAPKFIGDLPHTWVGAEYIRAVRSLFLYERERDDALVLGAGIPEQWVVNGTGVTLKRYPTYFGTLNYSMSHLQDGAIHLRMSGDLNLPPGGIVVHSPLNSSLKGVTVNGETIEKFATDKVIVRQFPAEVVLHY
ncbi:MAG: discoidin domain-containing protein [Pseudomonadota bacterium]